MLVDATSLSSLDHEHLKKLIRSQIPRFQSRPYLASVSDALASAVEEPELAAQPPNFPVPLLGGHV
mgnify:CR=1 FL=1